MSRQGHLFEEIINWLGPRYVESEMLLSHPGKGVWQGVRTWGLGGSWSIQMYTWKSLANNI